MINKKIESLAFKVLSFSNIVRASDINLHHICASHHITIREEDLENNISGLLVLKNNLPHIIYNSSESEHRQRFTIAHELGHYFLHKDSSVFVDTNKVLYRNSDSSRGEIKKEIEANNFAASLLMPEKFVLDEIKLYGKDFITVDDIDVLAEKFNVSSQAMSFRLSNLGFYF